MPTLFLDRQVQGEDFVISESLKDYLVKYSQSSEYRPESKRRSHLFVPIIRENYVAKIGKGEVAADTVIWDLEDGIPAESKPFARECIAKLPPKPRGVEYAVRMNAGDTEFVEEDIKAVAAYPFDSVMLPKAESAAVIARQMRLIGDDRSYAVTIETARGLQALDSIAQVLKPGRDALGFGVGDMSTDLGVERMSTCENPMFQQILGMIAFTGRRYGLELLDSVSARFNDPENARKEAELSYRCYGYSGKKLINPKQLDAINSVFSPTRAEIAGQIATLEAFLATTSKTNARVVGAEYKGLPAFIASERKVKRYLRQSYVSLSAGSHSPRLCADGSPYEAAEAAR